MTDSESVSPVGSVPETGPTTDERPEEFDFISLFLAEQRQIYCFIRALVPHAQDAEDILQETAAVLWRRFGEFEPGTSFSAWSSKVAHYCVLKYRDARGRETYPINDEVLESLAAVRLARGSGFDPRRAALEECLGRLSREDRAMIDYRYLHQATGRDVAARLGRPANSVYKSLSRIRRTLLECISRRMAVMDRSGGGR